MMKLLQSSYFHSPRFHRLMVTFWCCISFVGLGSAYLVFGPTLLDIASKLSVGVSTLSAMFFVRAVGTVGGSILSGVVMDKFERFSYSIFCVILISGFATTFVLPFSVHIAMLGVLMLLNGLALGSLDNGAHALLLKLWVDDSGPCMQVLHFAFGFGAFIAPLVAKHFISEEIELSTNFTDNLQNFTCYDISGESSGFLSIDEVTCLHTLNQTCNDNADVFNETFEDLLSNYCNGGSGSQFMVAFWITASLFVLPFVAFLYYSIKLECCVCGKGKQGFEHMNHVKNGSLALSKPNLAGKKSRLYLAVIFTLLFAFMFFYVGSESAYGSLVFTFAVKSELQFSKSSAAILTSVFWGTFAFIRLFSLVFVLLKVKSAVLITCNVLGSLIAVSILMFFPTNTTAVWIGSAVLGMSMAAIFPTAMTWMTENVPVSGKASAIVIAGGNLGDITLPAIVGVLIAEVRPISFIYFIFVTILVSAVVAAVMLVLAGVQQGKSATLLPNAKYEKLTNHVTEEEQLDDTGSSAIEEAAANGII